MLHYNLVVQSHTTREHVFSEDGRAMLACGPPRLLCAETDPGYVKGGAQDPKGGVG